MPAVERVLVVGGGTAGCAVAILLAQGGVEVEILEADSGSRAGGSGLTLQGNALRVARKLGVLDELLALGYPFNTLGLRAPDPDGSLIMEIDDVRMGGSDLPATLGLLRSELARVLRDRCRALGVRIVFGESFAGLESELDVVHVRRSGGTSDRFDLVIGADGIRSAIRTAIGITTAPKPTGMGIWRIVGRRPASITRTDLIYGGPVYIAGFAPTGASTFYAYLVEDAQDRTGLSAAEQLEIVRGLAAAYHGPWDDIRLAIDAGVDINYTLFESHVVPSPWHRGRVVLIGDAAHSCPPTLAQGAAMALEDAAVLAETLLGGERLDDALLARFVERRFARSELVVEASVQLGDWLLANEQHDVPGLVDRVATVLSTPA